MKNLTLKIDLLGGQGDGIASLDEARVLVPFSLAGETVSVDLDFEKNKDTQTANLVEILEASPLRRQAPCPHFGICGGCKIQHIVPEAYRAWKSDSVTGFLARQGIEAETLLAPVFIPERTRRRVTFSATRRGRKTLIGLHMAKSHTVFEVETCLLLTPELESLRAKLPELLSPILTDSKEASIFLQQADNGIEMVITGAIGQRGKPDLSVYEALPALLADTGIIRICWRATEKMRIEVMLESAAPILSIGDTHVSLPPMAFLQPSEGGQTALQQAVLQALEEHKTVKHNLGNIADLFSGVGTFTLPTTAYGTVSAYESEQKAIDALDHAARMTMKPVQTEQRDLFRYPLTVKELSVFETVILDPPRAGAKQQMDFLSQSSVRQVIYVSCNPGTFARDAAELLKSGYRLKSLRMVDQFIWSSHAEIVAVFKK